MYYKNSAAYFYLTMYSLYISLMVERRKKDEGKQSIKEFLKTADHTI